MYQTLDQSYGYPRYYSPILGRIQGPLYSTYTSPGWFDPGSTCFCQDPQVVAAIRRKNPNQIYCPPESHSCGACYYEQLCNDCNINYSGGCPSNPYFGGLNWSL